MNCDKHIGLGFSYCNLCEVERLRDEVAELRSALQKIRTLNVSAEGAYICPSDWMRAIADEAINEP